MVIGHSLYTKLLFFLLTHCDLAAFSLVC